MKRVMNNKNIIRKAQKQKRISVSFFKISKRLESDFHKEDW